MKSRKLTKTVLLALLPLAASADNTFGISVDEPPELAKIFNAHGITGTFVMLDARADTMFVWNQERAQQQFPPAATFRIANAVLALDAGVVRSIDEIVPFNAKQHRSYRTYETVRPYFYGTLGRGNRQMEEPQMELRKAMRVSSTRTFRALARGIGIDRMREGLTKLTYGNMRVGNEVDRFWKNGSLQISAVEQVEFLARVARGKIPVAGEVLNELRQLTLIEKTASYELHSKTGWLIATKPQLGWWVGWIERENAVFPFALNMDIDKGHAEDRVTIGRECLKALGKL